MCGPVGRVSELLLHIRALRDCLRNDYDRCILYMYKFILSSPRYIDDAIIIKKKKIVLNTSTTLLIRTLYY